MRWEVEKPGQRIRALVPGYFRPLMKCYATSHDMEFNDVVEAALRLFLQEHAWMTEEPKGMWVEVHSRYDRLFPKDED